MVSEVGFDPTPTYSGVSIIEKLPLAKYHTYLINILRTGQVQNNLISCYHYYGIKYFVYISLHYRKTVNPNITFAFAGLFGLF